jgi:hypothetical protein
MSVPIPLAIQTVKEMKYSKKSIALPLSCGITSGITYGKGMESDSIP